MEPNLNDGSDYGDWRLPTAHELFTLTSGDEPLLLAHGMTHFFVNVQEDKYWSSTTLDGDSTKAQAHDPDDRNAAFEAKTNSYYVWPVRGP